MPKLLRCGTHIWRKYAVLILILLFCPNFILFLHSQLKKKKLYCKNNQSHMKKKVCSGVKFIFFCWFTTMFCMNKMPFSFKKQNKQKKPLRILAFRIKILGKKKKKKMQLQSLSHNFTSLKFWGCLISKILIIHHETFSCQC